MKKITFNILCVFVMSSLTACAQDQNTPVNEDENLTSETQEIMKSEPHSYGGWYCPDNLNGFPAVDIAEWKNVPVVNGRMATKEETKNGTSLIFVDAEKYPNAKPLDMTMPKLARFYNHSTDRDELIIVIQAINVDNDSVVGFRFLNGGNGSAWLDEVKFLTDKEINQLIDSRFVSHSFQIKTGQDKIWPILTDPKNEDKLNSTFNKANKLQKDWRAKTNVNYSYAKSGAERAKYADKLFGCYYVQNDYQNLDYTEKFFLAENEETGITELKIVCGPFADDFDEQNLILKNWGQKVKELSEK